MPRNANDPDDQILHADGRWQCLICKRTASKIKRLPLRHNCESVTAEILQARKTPCIPCKYNSEDDPDLKGG